MHFLKLNKDDGTGPLYLDLSRIMVVIPATDNPMQPGATLIFNIGGTAEVKESAFNINLKLQEAGVTFLDCEG